MRRRPFQISPSFSCLICDGPSFLSSLALWQQGEVGATCLTRRSPASFNRRYSLVVRVQDSLKPPLLPGSFLLRRRRRPLSRFYSLFAPSSAATFSASLLDHSMLSKYMNIISSLVIFETLHEGVPIAQFKGMISKLVHDVNPARRGSAH